MRIKLYQQLAGYFFYLLFYQNFTKIQDNYYLYMELSSSDLFIAASIAFIKDPLKRQNRYRDIFMEFEASHVQYIIYR